MTKVYMIRETLVYKDKTNVCLPKVGWQSRDEALKGIKALIREGDILSNYRPFSEVVELDGDDIIAVAASDKDGDRILAEIITISVI